MPYANNKGADQPAHPHILISALFVRNPDRIICVLAKSKISRHWAVSVAGQAGLCLTWLQTPEDRFSHDVAHLLCCSNSSTEGGNIVCL